MAESKSSSDTTNKKQENSSRDVTDSDRELAQSAQNELNKGNYGGAINLLNKLLSSRPKDIKVLLNKGVSEYFKGDLKTTENFQKTLLDICNQAGIKLDKIDSSDEVEASVVRLNYCTVEFHQLQLLSATALLEKMYNGLESLEESVSIGLCLLLAECLLALAQPARALAVVAHTEATFLPQPLPPQASTKHLQNEKDSRSPEKSAKDGGGTFSGNSSHSLGGSPNIMNSHTSSDSIAGSSEMRCSADQELLRGKLQMLHVRALLMMRILKVAKKELKAVVTHAVNSGNQLNVTLIMLKSQLEYLRGSFTKAVKVLNQCAAIPPPPSAFYPKLGVAYYNNLGVIHFALWKPTLACYYLQKSLTQLREENANSDQKESRSLYHLGAGIDAKLYYNLGVTLLHMNKPIPAFDFFIEVVQVHPENPRLWLRLAECCISVHKLNIESKSIQKLRQSTTLLPGADGANKKICLRPNVNSHDKTLSEQQNINDAALPEPTLEFARLCLRNALSLIPKNVTTTNLTDEQEASGVLPDLHTACPSSPMRGSQLMQVKLSCLSCSAYASLCLGDYLLALRHAQNLLAFLPKVPHAEPDYKLLGHLYAGEALLHLGRTSEAISYFDPRQVGDIELSPSKQEGLGTQNIFASYSVAQPFNSSNCASLLQYNLSVAYSLKGQYDKASSFLKEVWNDRDENIPIQVILQALYINLQTGHTDVVRNILKKDVPSL